MEGGGYSSVVNERGLYEVIVTSLYAGHCMLGMVTAGQSAVFCRTGKLLPQSTLGGSARPSQAPKQTCPRHVVSLPWIVPTCMAEAERIIFLETFFMTCDYVHPPEVESKGTASG